MGKHTNYKIECEVNMSTLTWICNVNHAVSISDILTKAVIRGGGGGGPKHPQNIQLTYSFIICTRSNALHSV